jgi:MarR family transcriptional regulator, multiple antibiotic resistance protein MarR
MFPGRVLLGRVMSALRETHDKALAQFGVNTNQGTVLMNCIRGEANTPAQLAKFNNLDISSVSRMLDRMEQKGLVARSRTGKDRRQVIIRITPKGRALVKRAIPVAARVAAEAWRNVSEQERRTLRTIVYKILGNLGHLQKN